MLWRLAAWNRNVLPHDFSFFSKVSPLASTPGTLFHACVHIQLNANCSLISSFRSSSPHYDSIALGSKIGAGRQRLNVENKEREKEAPNSASHQASECRTWELDVNTLNFHLVLFFLTFLSLTSITDMSMHICMCMNTHIQHALFHLFMHSSIPST